MEKLNCKIIKNEFSEPLRCKAILCWEGAEFADGSVCTLEVMQKIVDSVDFSVFAPPLVVQHDWDANSAVGKITGLSIEDNQLIADVAVMDSDAQERIQSGVWDAVSVAFETPSYELIEVSLVAIPAIMGAKIEPVSDVENKANETKEEDNQEEGEAEAEPTKEVTEIDTPVDGEEKQEVKEGNDIEEEGCRKKKVVCEKEITTTILNAKILNDYQALVEKHEALLNEFNAYKNQIEAERREAKAEGIINEFVQNGLTLPANADSEKSFILSLTDTQVDAYITLKRSQSNLVTNGKRLSVSVDVSKDTRESSFLEGFQAFLKSKN